jgi:glutaminyl-tRNA synthetase
MAVLDPIKLVLSNWDEVMGAGFLDHCAAPVHPHLPDLGKRSFTMGKEVWIERTDYEDTPPKGFFRLFPGNRVRLKYGHVIECTGATKDAAGNISAITAKLIPDTKSGTPGSDAIKVKGVITWVAVADGIPAEVRMYDRLFSDAQPDAGGKDFIESLNPNSLKVVTAIVEPSLANALPDQKFQFERHGYFVADRVDHAAEKPVFNLAVGLKDGWGK